MTLAYAANGWIARHQADSVNVERVEPYVQSHAGRSEGRFTSGVPSAYDNDISFIPILHNFSSFPIIVSWILISVLNRIWQVIDQDEFTSAHTLECFHSYHNNSVPFAILLYK
jgi:hypothetical protein